MQIEVKSRNTPVNDELREYVERRFQKVAKQVSELARLEIELKEEKNPAIADNMVAEATLFLKGVTLRASDNARDLHEGPHEGEGQCALRRAVDLEVRVKAGVPLTHHLDVK